jgi:hypothetical protein
VEGDAITCTRAGTAYCTKSDGTMVVMSADRCRVEGAGLLVEPARTQLATNPQALNSWTAYDFTGLTPVVTANAMVDPTGATTAESVAFGQTLLPTDTRAFLVISPSLSAVPHAFSFWAKGNPSSSTIYPMITPDAVTYISSACAYTSAGWTQCQANGTPAAGVQNLLIGVDLRDGTQTGRAAQTVGLWHAQLEAGLGATSPIISGTRAGDAVSTQPSESISGEGCMAATVTFPSFAVTGGRIFGTSDAASPAYIASASSIAMHDGTNTVTVNTGALAGTTAVVRSTWTASTMTLHVGASSTTGTFDGSMNVGTVFFGSQNGASNYSLARMRNIKMGTSANGCLP